jgi:hypothetical protein
MKIYDPKRFYSNLAITGLCFALAALALLAPGLEREVRIVTVTAALAYPAGLLRRSGMGGAPPDDGASPPPAAAPLGGITGGPAMHVFCLAFLAFAGCRGGSVGGSVSWGSIWPWGPTPQFAATHISLLSQGSSPLPSSTAGLYAKSSDNMPRLVDTSGNEYVAGTAWRARLVAGTPGGVATGDLWHDTAASSPALMWRAPSGSLKLLDSVGNIAPTSLTLNGAAQSGASFYKTCTITSAAAATPVVCLAAADVPASLSAKLATWHAYVNGGTGWGTTATCVIEDTAGNEKRHFGNYFLGWKANRISTTYRGPSVSMGVQYTSIRYGRY